MVDAASNRPTFGQIKEAHDHNKSHRKQLEQKVGLAAAAATLVALGAILIFGPSGGSGLGKALSMAAFVAHPLGMYSLAPVLNGAREWQVERELGKEALELRPDAVEWSRLQLLLDNKTLSELKQG